MAKGVLGGVMVRGLSLVSPPGVCTLWNLNAQKGPKEMTWLEGIELKVLVSVQDLLPLRGVLGS